MRRVLRRGGARGAALARAVEEVGEGALCARGCVACVDEALSMLSEEEGTERAAEGAAAGDGIDAAELPAVRIADGRAALRQLAAVWEAEVPAAVVHVLLGGGDGPRRIGLAEALQRLRQVYLKLGEG